MRSLPQLLIASLFVAMTTPLLAADLAGPVHWQTSPKTALDTARQQNRPILMYFTTDYCGFCRQLDRNTWSNGAVAQTTNTLFIPLQVDGERFDHLAELLKVRGFPTTVVISPEGKELGRITGYVAPDKMLPRLQELSAAR